MSHAKVVRLDTTGCGVQGVLRSVKLEGDAFVENYYFTFKPYSTGTQKILQSVWCFDIEWRDSKLVFYLTYLAWLMIDGRYTVVVA